MEKQEFGFINYIAHPLPDPPPLCGGGDSNGKHALSTAALKMPLTTVAVRGNPQRNQIIETLMSSSTRRVKLPW